MAFDLLSYANSHEEIVHLSNHIHTDKSLGGV